jgi:carbonic anhydrase/acetyltransferase-like protein (isoleucine patch superfamily)
MKSTILTIMKKLFRAAILCLVAAFSAAVAVHAQTTEFTYQGRLTSSAQNATGSFDFEFRLFDAETGGTEIAVRQQFGVPVTGGIFSVKLDFGANFNGQARFLEVSARVTGTPDAFSILTPRQSFTSAPYAIKSLTAETATNALQLGGVDSNQFVATNDPRMTDDRNPLAGSTNYVQNTTTRQNSSNFNISGDGTLGGTLSAGMINAETQFNLGGSRVFSIGGDRNTIAGIRAGEVNTGSGNSFFGNFAGLSNTVGQNNSFFGRSAGVSNTTGEFNSYFGISAGSNNSTGSENSIFGAQAGAFNSLGSRNTFVGAGAGKQSSGSGNSFFGFSTGGSAFTGDNNTSVGFDALVNTSINGSVSSSTVIGAGSRVISGSPISFATAIGAGSEVATSNTVVLGRNLDSVEIPGSFKVTGATNFGGLLSANAVNSQTDFTIRGLKVLNANGISNLFAGNGAGQSVTTGRINVVFGGSGGQSITTGSFNSFLGAGAGQLTTGGSSNVFIGIDSARLNTTGSSNTALGALTDVGSNLNFATAIGAGARATTSNTIVLGRNLDTVQIPGSLNMAVVNADIQYNLGGSRVLSINGNANTFVGLEAGRSITNGNANSFFGNRAGTQNQTGAGNTFFGVETGSQNISGDGNSFFGNIAGSQTSSGSNNTFLGLNAGVANRTGGNNTAIGANANVANAGLNFATAIGAGAVATSSNVVVLGRFEDFVIVPGIAVINRIAGQGIQTLCRNPANQISTCSSSLRYKTNIAPFSSGLNLVNRLRPITFDWKDGGMKDLGLGAEDVAVVEPLLVTRNEKGEVEGVKYDRLGVVLLNAVKEQQAQIEAQQKLIEKQQAAIDGLKKLVCGQNPNAEVCMEEQK